MKAAEKSKQMEEVLEKVSQDQWGRSRLGSINNDICVSCGGPAKDFRDELSTKEFTISGFCQVCQDKTFGTPVPEDKDRPVKVLWWDMERLQSERDFHKVTGEPICDFCSKILVTSPLAIIDSFGVDILLEGKIHRFGPPWVCCPECSKSLGLSPESPSIPYSKVVAYWKLKVKGQLGFEPQTIDGGIRYA